MMAILPCEGAIITSNERLYNSVSLIWQTLLGSHTSIVSVPATSTKTAQEIIAWFREEELPIAAIADMARVERKSVYAWINGGPVRQQNQERLEKLYNLLSEEKQTKLVHLYRFWNRQLSSGKSLYVFLCEDQLNIQAIKQALSELWPMALRIEKMTPPKEQKNKDNNPYIDEIGEVIITDDT